jgi:hypothetical protein
MGLCGFEHLRRIGPFETERERVHLDQRGFTFLDVIFTQISTELRGIRCQQDFKRGFRFRIKEKEIQESEKKFWDQPFGLVMGSEMLVNSSQNLMDPSRLNHECDSGWVNCLCPHRLGGR